ncbi:MAG: hypothetical protein WCH43_06495, partial [Verrucomicrobiota bacterium]
GVILGSFLSAHEWGFLIAISDNFTHAAASCQSYPYGPTPITLHRLFNSIGFPRWPLLNLDVRLPLDVNSIREQRP